MEAGGYKFKTLLLNWNKLTKNMKPITGLGYWTRSSSEYLIMGTKG